jgi:CRISPR/Cas system-associated protein Cas10 (large subunit of type III CRISPR-Cas system)
MKNLSSQLSNVDKHVEELRRDFEESMKSAAQIKIDLDRELAAIQVHLKNITNNIPLFSGSRNHG